MSKAYSLLETLIEEANKRALRMGFTDRSVQVTFDVFDHPDRVFENEKISVRLRYRRISGMVLYERTIIIGCNPTPEEIKKHKNDMATEVLTTLIMQKSALEYSVEIGQISFL